MNLNDLSAKQLARLDASCLEFESALRSGNSLDIEQFIARSGIEHEDLLRTELRAIQNEVQESRAQMSRKPFGSPGDFATQPVGDTPSFRSFSNSQDSWIPTAGSTIGPYQVVGQLGRGGMGVVLDAVDSRLGRRVAIKMLALRSVVASGTQQQKMMERFEREARAVAALSHPNIVELFDVGNNDGIPYAVMEYLQGETLDQRFERHALTTTEVRLLGTLIAEALSEAHHNEVIHRDLKPQNIMLVSPNLKGEDETSVRNDLSEVRLKVFDFGLSRMPYEKDSQDQTNAGSIMGTPGYMSPEQARGETATQATDIFSLGCILYEAFFGRRAIEGDTPADRIAATLQEIVDFDPVRRRDDADLCDLIQNCLIHDPAQRPTASTIVEVLADNRVDRLREMMESGYESGLRTRRRFLTSLAGGLAGAITAGLVFRGSGDPDIHSIAVLPLSDLTPRDPASIKMDGKPLGLRPLDRGQRLAVLLINELSRISDLEVRPYRPISTDENTDLMSLGRTLDVDAILQGRIETSSDGQQYLNMELVSVNQGRLLWGNSFKVENEDLLDQTGIIQQVAKRVGHKLTMSEQMPSAEEETFKCLLDGQARSDPESVEGLKQALHCFTMARDSGAGNDYAATHAGIALTSITLASQSSDDQVFDYIRQAQEESIAALKLDSMSVDARLAQAMIAWQTGRHYRDAQMILRELVLKQPYHWQVKHQFGLLLLTIGEQTKGIAALRDASRLNPLSVMVKIDLLRAHWFTGQVERAKKDAIRYMEKFDGHPLVRGLLIDIHEQSGAYAEAAKVHPNFNGPLPATRESYMEQREKLLVNNGYGPFGPGMNQAVFQARFQTIDDNSLADLIEAQLPALPYLIASHPAMQSLRINPRVSELLTNDQI